MSGQFELPPELEIFRQTARAFAQRELEPLVDVAEATERFPVDLFKRAGDAGLIGTQYPIEDGGGGGGILGACLLREELSYVSVGLSSGLGHQDHVGTSYLVEHASPEQKERWLRPALAGEHVIVWAVTEPDAGSDVRAIRTKVSQDGDSFILSGRKTYITNGPLADWVQVVARLDGSDRFGVYVVHRDDEGYECERTIEKMGARSSQIGELRFDDVRLSDDRRLSPPEGARLGEILDVLIKGRVLIAAGAVGFAQRAFDVGLEYAKQRKAFGSPIGKFQEISMKFAEAQTRLEAARLLTYRAASRCDTSPVTPIADCSQAKLFAAETALWITDQMMRVFGGAGFMRESVIERLYRDARFFQIVEGTTEIQHRILARQLGL